MLFNSWEFALFLPIVFALYWLISGKRLQVQNILLLAASYFFYSCWDWRFLFLLIFSTGLDYFTGLMVTGSDGFKKKFWFWLSIIVNLGLLGVFKYYNFFAESFADMLGAVGFKASFATLNVILPVGISFYTFHGVSYVIDIYKGRIEPERNFVTYSLFVSYFPLLVAGPIERATHLLPQIKRERKFDYAKAMDGFYQILWGLFKKVVVADSCAQYVNFIFDNPGEMNSVTLALGGVFFAFQVYGDFSGYSDIALGTSKLFGIDLLRNFNYPYFSRDIAEFWRRWHISLSSWFRDYLYIPLGGSKGGMWMKIRNTFIIFLVSGFWHGADWTFVIWGGLHAVYMLPLLIRKSNRTDLNIVAEGKLFPSLRDFLGICFTFGIHSFALIIFRSESIGAAFDYIARMFTFTLEGSWQHKELGRYIPELLPLIGLFVVVEWLSRSHEHPVFGKFKWVKAMAIIGGILVLGAFSNPESFIYFQF
ncbi:MBOAT family O-acyltransferase [Flavobacterium selenitireducens]|uniref:MBOAT family O-acyltransferase n=1 Tax=Flavobacterium selenitireducens TaxID=2722704 RepID=UPI00168A9F43|nr:MBOAT family protein [Flavobacterium selenitireducens]MBD3583491.1 MBOAT family protein [Flavobacterium selenitireducens]